MATGRLFRRFAVKPETNLEEELAVAEQPHWSRRFDLTRKTFSCHDSSVKLNAKQNQAAAVIHPPAASV